jgi:hypothetical protein
MNKADSRSLNMRALTVLMMACSFACLPPAGFALHFASAAPFQPTRHLLMTIHDLAGLIFLAALVLHLKFNWRPLLNYLRVTSGRLGTYRRELLIAGLSVATPLALGILHVFVLGGG